MRKKTHDNRQLLRSKMIRMRFNFEVPQRLDSDRLGSELVYCLASNVKQPLVPLNFVGSFFDFVPSRLGHNAALDNAISCLCTIYRGTSSTSHSSGKEIYGTYAKALASLRTCIDDPSLQLEPETLCASILLQVCELALNIGRGEWTQLARGTACLLESRGTSRYASPFEHAMLDSQLPYIFGQSMKFRERCFLEDANWQKLLARRPILSMRTPQPRSWFSRCRLIGILAELPGLIKAHAAILERPDSRKWDDERASLMLGAYHKFDEVQSWLTMELEPLFFSTNPSLMEHIIYPDIISAILDSVANTAMATLYNIVESLLRVLDKDSLPFPDRDDFLKKKIIMERCRARALAAYEFVKGESALAAKPLDFGLRQIQAIGDDQMARII